MCINLHYFCDFKFETRNIRLLLSTMSSSGDVTFPREGPAEIKAHGGHPHKHAQNDVVAHETNS